jgi:hypothetical protein
MFRNTEQGKNSKSQTNDHKYKGNKLANDRRASATAEHDIKEFIDIWTCYSAA